MKKIFFLAIAFASIIISGCSESTDKTKNASNELPEIIKSFSYINLLDKGYPLEILIPDSNIGTAKVIQQSYGETHILVGERFQISIAEGGDLELRKSDIESDLVYKNTIIESDSTGIIYKSEIAESGIEPAYHFYLVKEINGIKYEIQSIHSDISFSEKWAKRMMESAKRIKPIEKSEA